MIRLGKLTDYAIVVMARLAREGDNAARSASFLADQTGLPEPTVAKVLKILSKDSLVTSVRGAQGGYKMERKPSALTIREIIESMEGPIAITSCVEGTGEHCQMESRCATKGKWDPVNRAIRDALSDITLADMMAQQGGHRSVVNVRLPEAVKV